MEKENKNVQWGIRVTAELDQKVETVANMLGLSKTEVVRFAVAQYVGGMTKGMEAITEQVMAELIKNAR